MKKEKSWILRGTICRYEPEKKFVVLRLDSFQSGNAKAFRYEKGKPWLNMALLQGAPEQFNHLYLGEEVTVWVSERQEGENKKYSLKRIEEKVPQENDGEIQDVATFLENCI